MRNGRSEIKGGNKERRKLEKKGGREEVRKKGMEEVRTLGR